MHSMILDLTDEAFDRKAWHGPNLLGSIRGVNARRAAWRPKRGRHNIAEIVLHAAYWKYAVRRRLTGGRRGSFPLAGSNWFKAQVDERTWRGLVRLLIEQHRKLRDVVRVFREDELSKRAPGSRHTRFRLMAGIAAHDVYHAGQIQLIKRLFKSVV